MLAGSLLALLPQHTLMQHMQLSCNGMYACRKYGDPRIVADAGYNLVYALHRFDYDADCDLFLKMVTGKLCCSFSLAALGSVLQAACRRCVYGTAVKLFADCCHMLPLHLCLAIRSMYGVLNPSDLPSC